MKDMVKELETIKKLSLEKSELRYRRLFESAQDGILILDVDTGVIEDVNPYLVKMLGYSHEELLGKRIWDVGAFQDINTSRDAFRELQDHQYNRYEDLPLRTKGGRLIQVEFISNVYLVGYEKVIQCIIRDVTEKKKSEKRMQTQLEHLAALSAIDRVVAANFDLKLCLSEILIHVTNELGIDAAEIMLLNPNSLILEFGAERGFRTKGARDGKVRLGESYAGIAALERQLVQISNLSEKPDNSIFASFLKDEDFTCYYGVPLIAKGQVKGVLEIFNRTSFEPDAEWFEFLNALAGQTAIAIENSSLFENLQRSNLELALAYDATIEGWSHALDLRDKETEGHTQRVTEMTVELARAFGLSEAELVQVRWGALLHDIGKLGVPDKILLKTSSLTKKEWLVMKKHPIFAFEMLSPIRYLRLAVDIPYCHHEKWDGTGYPNGLKDIQIPLTARIFSVVDVWDALNSDRPYRTAWTKEKICEHILAASGTDFDPKVVDAFMPILNS